MALENMNCPNCGAPLEITNRFAKVIVCKYCNSHIMLEAEGAKVEGQYAKLAEYPSIFSVGATGEIDGKPFEVKGRIRYAYEGGFWDEWFIILDGKPVWLSEDEGTYKIYYEREFESMVPAYDELSPGSVIEVNDMKMSVIEKGEAKVLGAEGELMFWAKPGLEVKYVDCVGKGKVASIEYTPNEIELFIGKRLHDEDIVVNKQF